METPETPLDSPLYCTLQSVPAGVKLLIGCFVLQLYIEFTDPSLY